MDLSFDFEIEEVDVKSRAAVQLLRGLLDHPDLKDYLTDRSRDYKKVGLGCRALIMTKLGMALAHRNKWNEAKQALREAIKLAPQGGYGLLTREPIYDPAKEDVLAYAQTSLAIVAYLSGDTIEAMASLGAVPHSSKVLCRAKSVMGRILAEGGEFDAAAVRLTEALRLNCPRELVGVGFSKLNETLLDVVEQGKAVPQQHRLSVEDL